MRTFYSAIVHNAFLKITALFLAVFTWAYIANVLYSSVPDWQKSSQAVVKLRGENVIVKRLPVHVNLVGTPNDRYTVAIDRIRISPLDCVASGPLDKIEAVSFITTEPISVDKATKDIRRNVMIKEIEGIDINIEQKFRVEVPIIRKRHR
ncbi:MAG: hypothetical protein V2A72_07230 [Candidatus Omnitrophota bacterium]